MRGNKKNNRKGDESPKEMELRTTWNKKGPSIASNKLPAAFVTSSTFINQNQVAEIDKVVEQEEQKQMNQMLSPIKKERGRRLEIETKNNGHYYQLSKERQLSIQDRHSQKPQVFKRKQNPLAPIKKYMANMEKLEEQMENNMQVQHSIQELVQNYHSHNNRYGRKGQNRHLLTSRVKLDEMITLDYFQTDIDRNTRRLLHIPSLTIYVLKEYILYNKEYRKNIKEWIMYWQNIMNLHNINNKQQQQQQQQLIQCHFIKLYDTYWNQPEGRVSILMEYLNGGSLQDLLNTVDNLPFCMVVMIMNQTVDILEHVHNGDDDNIINLFYGGLTSSQILFNRDSNNNTKIQLNMGKQKNKKLFEHRIKDSEYFNQTAGFKMQQMDNDQYFTPDVKSNLRNTRSETALNLQEEQKNDVFALAIIILESIIGLHNKHLSLYLDNETKEILKMNAFLLSIDPSLCCILHSEQQINQINKQNQQKQYLLIKELLDHQVKEPVFISILCKCLQIDWHRRISIQELSGLLEQYENQQESKFHFSDFVKINSNYLNNNNKSIMSGEQLDKFLEQMSMVLQQCKKWFSESKFGKYILVWKDLKNNHNPINLHKINQLTNILKVDSSVFINKLSSINPYSH